MSSINDVQMPAFITSGELFEDGHAASLRLCQRRGHHYEAETNDLIRSAVVIY
jgi:hypothetical protein